MQQFLAMLLIIFSTRAFSHTGTSVAGAVTLSGIFKSMIMKSTIPLGGVTTFYGYESLEYPETTPVYCFGGVGLSTGNSLVGVSFGGQVNNIATKGKCETPQDYLGGFLSIGVGYDFQEVGSSKKMGVQTSYNIGFDLGFFNQRIIKTLSTKSMTNRTLKKRIRDVVWHLVRYSSKASKVNTGGNLHFLKLMLLPLITSTGPDWKTALGNMKLSVSDVQKIQNIKEVSSLRKKISELFYQIKRDPDFYDNSSADADEIFVDSLQLLEALEKAIGECHSASYGVTPMSTLDLKLPFLSTNFSFSFSYSYYGLQNILGAKTNSSLAASKAFASHRFTEKSSSCQHVEQTAGESFGELLGILGVGNSK